MSLVVVLLSIIILLVIHEFGHFIVAKKLGVKVEEFGVGYPPRLFGKQIGETLYSINLIPFGAFVRVAGEMEKSADIESSKQFTGRPIWQRAAIIFAGVASFWIVAAILLSFVFATGVSQSVSDDEIVDNAQVQVLAVSKNSPAELAGLMPGDSIKDFSKISEIQEFSDLHKGEEVALTIQRGQETFDVTLTPRADHPADEGPVGVALVRVAEKSYPWYQAPLKGIEATANLTYNIIASWVDIIKGLVLGSGMPQGVQFVGPIGIGSLLNNALGVGVNYFLQFIALLAVYLAIFNILPIPALDGGKLMFLGIEKLKGKPINAKLEQNITAGFFITLIVIMAVVTIKDIINLF